MRIALFHSLPSGGALRSAAGQARYLARAHRIDLYTLSLAETELEEVSRHCSTRRVYPFEPSAPVRRPFGMFDPIVRLRDLDRLDEVHRAVAADLERDRPDVVLVHPCVVTQAPRLLEHVTRPALYYCHEPPRRLFEPDPALEDGGGAWERFRRWRHRPLARRLVDRLVALDRQAVLRADRVVTNSRFMQETIGRVYGVRAPVVYHGIDADRFTPGPGVGRESFVLSVGALSPLKGFDFLVEALAGVATDLRPRLVLVADRGREGEAGRLAGLARGSGVDLRIESRIPDRALVDLYRRAACFVYAPVREPFGLAPLEALACGTPVVAVAEGGVLETVRHGVTGLLCEREPGAFGRTLERLLREPRLGEELGGRGRADVHERWTWEVAGPGIEEHLAEVARGGRASVSGSPVDGGRQAM